MRCMLPSNHTCPHCLPVPGNPHAAALQQHRCAPRPPDCNALPTQHSAQASPADAAYVGLRRGHPVAHHPTRTGNRHDPPRELQEAWTGRCPVGRLAKGQARPTLSAV